MLHHNEPCHAPWWSFGLPGPAVCHPLSSTLYVGKRKTFGIYPNGVLKALKIIAA